MISNDRQLMTTKEAAEYLGFRATTLRNARHAGKLAGVLSPGYRKIGSSVRYEKTILDDWLAQFTLQTSTSQSVHASS